MIEYETFTQAVGNFALALPRIAAAFAILPLLTEKSAPPMMRNIFLASLTFIVFPYVSHDIKAAAVEGIFIVPILLKEVFLGIVIGYCFSIIFWAAEGVGQVIDNKIGASLAQISDPLQGHQTTLNGDFLSQLAAYVFIAFGGLLIFLDIIFSSYLVWPISSPMPNLDAVSQLFIIGRFSELIRLILLLSAPALVLLTIIEVGLGLVNRYAQQLNVLTLSLSIKAWFGTFVLLIMLTSIVEFIVSWFSEQKSLLDALKLLYS